MKVGLTGSIGTGKSTVSDILRVKGFKIIDADKIAKDVMESEECIDKIIKAFGNFLLDHQRKVDRRALRNLIFSNKDAKKILEAIIHPLIKARIDEEYTKCKTEKIVIFDIPLLFETGYDKNMDKVIVIACEEDIQIKRIIKRDKTSPKKAEMIIRAQMSQEEKISRADYVIYNNGSIMELEENVVKVMKSI